MGESLRLRHLLPVILLLPVFCMARTWLVEQDGSEDFTVIQDAVDASASGDTIRIGPGRYEDTVPFVTPFVNWTVYVNLPGTDLTFIGAGEDATIIGPTVPGDMSPITGRRGFADWPNEIGHLVVEGIGLENVYTGYDVGSNIFEMRDCRVSGCYNGIMLSAPSSSLVERCEFIENNLGVDLRPPCTNPVIRECYFEKSEISDIMGGVFAINVLGFIVEDCTFEGVQLYHQASSGTIRGSSILNAYGQSVILISGSYEINDNIIDGTHHSECIKLELNAIVVGSGNILKGASFRAVGVLNSQISLTNNHIITDADYVHAYGFLNPPLAELEFRDNYWGTSDSAELAARIHDGYDDPSEYVHVLYEPYSNVPMSNEERSWGEIKALYKQ